MRRVIPQFWADAEATVEFKRGGVRAALHAYAFILLLICAMAVVELNDARTARKVAEEQAAALQAELKDYAGVRLVNADGAWKCSTPTRIQRQWSSVVASQCEALAKTLQNARATE